MKTREELKILFSDIKGSKEYLRGTTWSVTMFEHQPLYYGEMYHFRVYAKMSGSLFEDYNKGQQLCADVKYRFDLKTNKLVRELDIKELAPNLRCHVNLDELLDKI